MTLEKKDIDDGIEIAKSLFTGVGELVVMANELMVDSTVVEQPPFNANEHWRHMESVLEADGFDIKPIELHYKSTLIYGYGHGHGVELAVKK